MVGNTIEKIKQIGHDVAHSWYFRFWAFSWLVLSLVVFSALIILSKSSEQAAQQKDVVFWVENTTSIQFPKFHFRLDHRGNETFINYQCTAGPNNVPLNPVPCMGWKGFEPPMNICLAFDSDSVIAYNDWTREDQRINCQLHTQGVGPDGNMMAAFELEGEFVFSSGGNAYASVWMAPNDMAWILLENALLQVGKTSNQVQLWNRDLIYHSTVSQNNLYNVTVIMGSFFVEHYDPKDTYNGWMTLGDIGGVGFFMAVLHTIFMIMIGFFFSNTSTFLSGGNESKY